MEIIIIIIPSAIAVTAIFIIGAEILLLLSLAAINRFAIKYSNFKWYDFKNGVQKYSFILGFTNGFLRSSLEEERQKQKAKQKTLSMKTRSGNKNRC